ncbi:Sll0314/Alr1548 family TPR repeat-containing protein [Lyngbya aestuarii]|uniref:Sll0314/Alr1548 family TPR repeat-containing protein n=1 Tax=Lyngbya aestuarii TaxID=118322 RepID=UPI00403DD550
MTMITWFPSAKRTAKAFASIATLLLGVWTTPTFGADPFRTTEPHQIGDNTQAAFESIFKEGNYQQAKLYLKEAESAEASEPLVYAMLASLAYTENNWENLNKYASKTRKTAEQMIDTDPLRGHLYTAVGHFLEGAYDFEKQGPLSTLSKLQKVFQNLDEAKKIDPNDPELNLISGYMDLMLAVNLPFSDPTQAVKKLETYGSPSYLAYRGIAVGYRDLKKYPEAMEFVNRALALTPNNPELLYLKAQIFVKQDKPQEGLDFFQKALEKEAQLPNYSVAQMVYEQCKAQEKVDSVDRDCHGERDKIRERQN